MQSRNRKPQTRNHKGQALIEMAVASIFAVPVVLGLLDATTMVICNSVNDAVAKNAARAAANQPDQTNAQQAALNVVGNVKKSSIITNVSLNPINYSPKHDAVTVQTKMEVALPVQIVGMQHLTFVAQSVQPIVSE